MSRLNNGDKIIADFIIGNNIYLWVVIPADGSDAYSYWNNSSSLLDLISSTGPSLTEERRACGKVYCCLSGESAWAGNIGYCTGTGRELK